MRALFFLCALQLRVTGSLAPLLKRHGAKSNAKVPTAYSPANSILKATPRRSAVVVQGGLFGLGAPEIAVIVAVGAFILGPSKLAQLAKEAGKGAGDLKNVPLEFQKGFQSAEASEETKKVARELGRGTVTLKETVGDLVGDYKEVAVEFSEGLRQSAREANNGIGKSSFDAFFFSYITSSQNLWEALKRPTNL